MKFSFLISKDGLHQSKWILLPPKTRGYRKSRKRTPNVKIEFLRCLMNLRTVTFFNQNKSFFLNIIFCVRTQNGLFCESNDFIYLLIRRLWFCRACSLFSWFFRWFSSRMSFSFPITHISILSRKGVTYLERWQHLLKQTAWKGSRNEILRTFESS